MWFKQQVLFELAYEQAVRDLRIVAVSFRLDGSFRLLIAPAHSHHCAEQGSKTN